MLKSTHLRTKEYVGTTIKAFNVRELTLTKHWYIQYILNEKKQNFTIFDIEKSSSPGRLSEAVVLFLFSYT